MAVAGGKGGVGTTTIAVNLAVTLASRRHRTVLADLSPSGSGAAPLDHFAGGWTAAEGLDGRRALAEVLEPGPGGVLVLPASWASGAGWPTAEPSEQGLIEQFHGLGPIADYVVVDAGNTPTSLARRLCQSSEKLLLLATPALPSIMNAYAMVKGLARTSGLPTIGTVVNMAPAESVADDIHNRLATACRRFLGVASQPAGYVPYASQIEQMGGRGGPFVLAAPGGLASRQIAQLASWVEGR